MIIIIIIFFSQRFYLYDVGMAHAVDGYALYNYVSYIQCMFTVVVSCSRQTNSSKDENESSVKRNGF